MIEFTYNFWVFEPNNGFTKTNPNSDSTAGIRIFVQAYLLDVFWDRELCETFLNYEIGNFFYGIKQYKRNNQLGCLYASLSFYCNKSISHEGVWYTSRRTSVTYRDACTILCCFCPCISKFYGRKYDSTLTTIVWWVIVVENLNIVIEAIEFVYMMGFRGYVGMLWSIWRW